MKKIIIAGLFLVLLGGCVWPLSKQGQEAGETTAELKNYAFEFLVERGVTSDVAELFISKIKQRIAAYGYEESQVAWTADNTLAVELKEKSGVVFLEDDFIDYMINTPTFELKAEEAAENLFLSNEEKDALETYNRNARERAQNLLNGVMAAPETFAEVARENSQDPGSRENGGAYVGVKQGEFVPEFEAVIFNELAVDEIYAELVETDFGYHIIKKDGERGEGDEREVDTSHILITKQSEEQLLAAKQWLDTGLNGLYITKVNPAQQNESTFAFELVFDERGSDILAQITRENLGRRMGIFFDELNIGTATINEEIVDGILIIGGNFSADQVGIVAQRLNSGTIHARLSAVE